MQNNKKKKKKLRFKGIIVLLLFGYLLFSLAYYIYKLPIKSIEIDGNNYLRDNYIINYLNIDKDSWVKLSTRKVRNKLNKIPLVKSSKVRKDINGFIRIEIVEDRILFLNRNDNLIVLASGNTTEYNNSYLGIPTLINYVPDEVYTDFVKRFSKIDKENVKLISEIEYSPDVVNDITVDETRFLFRMNDGNTVYLNTINIEKFNNYMDIYNAISKKEGYTPGCLYLDSSSENLHFRSCDSDIVKDNENEN